MKPDLQTSLLTGVAGVFGGTTSGVAAFFALTFYGANRGCLPWIDALYGTAGYESCGLFGAMMGIMFGAILGAFVASVAVIAQPRRAIVWLAVATLVVPSTTGIVLLWPQWNLFFPLILPTTGIFIVASMIPASLTAALLHARRARA